MTHTWLPGDRDTLPVLPPLLRMSGGGGVSALGRSSRGERCAAAAGVLVSLSPFRKSGLLLRRWCVLQKQRLLDRRSTWPRCVFRSPIEMITGHHKQNGKHKKPLCRTEKNNILLNMSLPEVL